MKVNLIKEAEYELNEEKSTKVPFGTFCKKYYNRPVEIALYSL